MTDNNVMLPVSRPRHALFAAVLAVLLPVAAGAEQPLFDAHLHYNGDHAATLTPEDIVTNPADDYVREFVQGISRLKLVRAHTIMEKLNGAALPADAPRADGGSDLDSLIDISVNTSGPIVITENGQEVGVVSKETLLRGIQGGKA